MTKGDEAERAEFEWPVLPLYDELAPERGWGLNEWLVVMPPPRIEELVLKPLDPILIAVIICSMVRVERVSPGWWK